MPVAAARELLTAAERGGYALPGFNVSNVELALGVLDAAEARRAAVLLQLNRSNAEHMGGLETATAVLRALAGRAAVPVGIHLDHGADEATLRRAVAAGCTSLMYDGSTLPLDRNLRETRAAVQLAARAGLALEAELGHVGGREPGVVTSEAQLTDPAAAARFVEETGIDALAVSVGTAHGLAGEVRIDLVRELRVATRGLPLVLHGGSGVEPGALAEAVAAGVRKVNVSSEIHAAFARALVGTLGERDTDPRPALRAARAEVAAAAAARIDALGAARSA
jgi:ketose-bisphosphate aldolase